MADEVERSPETGGAGDRGGVGESGEHDLGGPSPGEALFPEDYVAPVGPWHRGGGGREAREAPAGGGRERLQRPDNIEDGPEWREYTDGIKGFERSSGGVSLVYPVGLTPATYVPHGKYWRIIKTTRGRPPRSHLTKNEHRLKKALDLMKDVISRVDSLRYNRELKSIASLVIRNYLEYMARENKPIKTKDISVLVAAALYKTAQVLGISASRGAIIEAVASSPYGEASVDYIDSRLWTITKNFNSIKEIKELFSRASHEGRRAGRIHRVVRRSMNFVDFIVSRLDSVNYLDKTKISRIAKGIILDSYRNRKSFDGKRAEALAAASVYIAARLMDYEINQRTVARIVNISEANIRKAFRFLMEGQVIVVYLKQIEPPPEKKPIKDVDL